MSKLNAALRALISLVVLVGLVAGIPWALLQWSDWPITGVPTGEQLRDAPTTLVTDEAILSAVVVALWAVWLILTLSVITEIINQLRGAKRQYSFGGPAQRLASGLVGSIVMSFASTGAAGASTSAEIPPAAVAELGSGATDGIGYTMGDVLFTDLPTSANQEPGGQLGPSGVEGEGGVVVSDETPGVIEEGDSGVETEPGFGDPAGESDPADEPDPGGGAHDGASEGQTGEAPSDDHTDGAAPEAPAPEAPAPEAPTGEAPAGPPTVVVGHGDTPWSLAEQHLGDGMRWREIWELNQGVTQADGRVWSEASGSIHPGWDLTLPNDAVGASQASPTTAAGQAGQFAPGHEMPEVVVVAPGDHFWGLAENQLTEAWGRAPTNAEITPYWQEVVEANQHRLLPPGDPDLIFPEQSFTLPAVPADPLAPPPPAQPTDPGGGQQDTSQTGEQGSSPDGEEGAGETGAGETGSGEEGSGQTGASETGSEEEGFGESGTGEAGSGETEEPGEEGDPIGQTGPYEPTPTTLPGSTPEEPTTPTTEETTSTTEETPDTTEEETPTTTEETTDTTEESTSTTEPTTSTTESEDGDRSAVPQPPSQDQELTSNSGEGDGDSSGSSMAPVGLLGGGAALAGILLLLERRRRAQLRRRARGDGVSVPPEGMRAHEAEVRDAADAGSAKLLDAALRAAAAGSGTTGVPRLRWVEVSADAVTLVLEEPSPPPPGFRPVGPDQWQTYSTLDQLEVMGSSAAAPAPSLVPVGATQFGAELFIELEGTVLTSIDAPVEETHAALRALAVAAASAPWSDHTRVLLVGMEGELTEMPWVDSVATLDEALLAAEVRAERVGRALRSIGCSTAGQARAAGAMPEEWDPLVVLSAVAPEGADARRRLSSLAVRSHSAVGLVLPPARDGGTLGRTMVLQPDGSLMIDGVDVPVWPRMLSQEDVENLVRMVDVGGAHEQSLIPDGRGLADGSRLRRPSMATTSTPPPPPPPPGAAPPPPPEAVMPSPESVATAFVAPEPLVSEPVESAPAVPEPSAGPVEGDGSPRVPDMEEVVFEPVEFEKVEFEPVEIEPLNLEGFDADDRVVETAPVGAESSNGTRVDPLPDDSLDVVPVPSEAPAGLVAEILEQVEVMVRVLGEVEAVRFGGRDRKTEEKLVPSRQKGLEAVSYLALREAAVDREDLEASLFPSGTNSAKTMYNAISAARSLLGDDLFPSPGGGQYELAESVVTDYGLFCELVAEADETDDAGRAADLLAAALDFVRGEPFVGVGRNYAWVGPHRGMIVAQVIDAADELGEVRLAQGDWRAAEWAARQGLRCFPSDERMYRLLMRTAKAAGNIPGVHRVFRELCEVIADPDVGVEPEDTVHPETVSLYEELTGSSPRVDA